MYYICPWCYKRSFILTDYHTVYATPSFRHSCMLAVVMSPLHDETLRCIFLKCHLIRQETYGSQVLKYT